MLVLLSFHALCEMTLDTDHYQQQYDAVLKNNHIFKRNSGLLHMVLVNEKMTKIALRAMLR